VRALSFLYTATFFAFSCPSAFTTRSHISRFRRNGKTAAKIAAEQGHKGISDVLEPSYCRRVVEGVVKSILLGLFKRFPHAPAIPPVTFAVIVTCFAMFLFPRLVVILWHGGLGATRAEMLVGLSQNATGIRHAKSHELVIPFDGSATSLHPNAEVHLLSQVDSCLIPYQRQSSAQFVAFFMAWYLILSRKYVRGDDFGVAVVFLLLFKYALDFFDTIKVFKPSVSSYWTATDRRVALELPGFVSWINAVDLGIVGVAVFLVRKQKMHFLVLLLGAFWLFCVQDKCQGIVISNFALMPYHNQASHQIWRLLTSVFTHAGWLHALSNMHTFLSHSDLERQIGSILFAILMLLSGVGANVIMYIVDRGSKLLLHDGSTQQFGYVGFSGALYGVMFAHYFLLSMATTDKRQSYYFRWTAWLMMLKELALHIASATDDSRVFMVIILFVLWIIESKVFAVNESSMQSSSFVLFIQSSIQTFMHGKIAHLEHFNGALRALLFLPFIVVFAPRHSKLLKFRYNFRPRLLDSKLKITAEAACAVLVLAALVVSFLFIEHLDPLPEFDLSSSDLGDLS
jgi:membrane associated rhomboid family serine protease